MATLLELSGFLGSPEYNILVKKIRAAVVKKAVALANLASPNAAQVRWAKETLANPAATASVVVHYVIGENAGFTIAQISGASDNSIQTNVNNAVDKVLAL